MNTRVRVQDKGTWIGLGTGSGTGTDRWTEGLHTGTVGRGAAGWTERAMRNTGRGEQRDKREGRGAGREQGERLGLHSVTLGCRRGTDGQTDGGAAQCHTRMGDTDGQTDRRATWCHTRWGSGRGAGSQTDGQDGRGAAVPVPLGRWRDGRSGGLEQGQRALGAQREGAISNKTPSLGDPSHSTPSTCTQGAQGLCSPHTEKWGEGGSGVWGQWGVGAVG